MSVGQGRAAASKELPGSRTNAGRRPRPVWVREAALARLLKQHRIRRVDAETALGVLCRPAIAAGAGVTEAAVLHVRSLVVRLRLANREFRQAERRLDEICAALGKEAPDVEDGRPRDAAILASMPGVGRSTPATLLTEAAGPLGRRIMPRGVV